MFHTHTTHTQEQEKGWQWQRVKGGVGGLIVQDKAGFCSPVTELGNILMLDMLYIYEVCMWCIISMWEAMSGLGVWVIVMCTLLAQAYCPCTADPACTVHLPHPHARTRIHVGSTPTPSTPTLPVPSACHGRSIFLADTPAMLPAAHGLAAGPGGPPQTLLPTSMPQRPPPHSPLQSTHLSLVLGCMLHEHFFSCSAPMCLQLFLEGATGGACVKGSVITALAGPCDGHFTALAASMCTCSHLAHLGSGEVVGIEGVHAMELMVGREEHDRPPPAVLMIVFVAMGFRMSSVGHLAGIQVALVLDLMDSVLTQQHIAVMLKVVQHCVKPSLTLLAFGGEVVVHGWVYYIIPYNVQHALGPPKSGLANTHYIAHTTNAPECLTHVIPQLDPAAQGQTQQCQHYGGNSVP
ncbi:hypothetical protein B0H10DRAFT_1970472 [Mycena sp. CBHHK59/15]|nr:hypothetical protein B0H10DRAFT_1970472 [Mycena sp. CBHHK59/15]